MVKFIDIQWVHVAILRVWNPVNRRLCCGFYWRIGSRIFLLCLYQGIICILRFIWRCYIIISILKIRRHLKTAYSWYLHVAIRYRTDIYGVYTCIGWSWSYIWRCIGSKITLIVVFIHQRSNQKEQTQGQAEKSQCQQSPTQDLFPITVTTNSVFRLWLCDDLIGTLINWHMFASVFPVHLDAGQG